MQGRRQYRKRLVGAQVELNLNAGVILDIVFRAKNRRTMFSWENASIGVQREARGNFSGTHWRATSPSPLIVYRNYLRASNLKQFNLEHTRANLARDERFAAPQAHQN